MKLLIADDERQIREGLPLLIDFTSLGFEKLYFAKNGQEALDLIVSYQPDLCILDIKMPEMTGIEVVEQLVAKGRLPWVILLSGHQEFEYARKAIALGVKDYMLKPLDEEAMVDLLKAAVDKILKEKAGYHMGVIHAFRKLLMGDRQALNHLEAMSFDGMPWSHCQIGFLMCEADAYQDLEGLIKEYLQKPILIEVQKGLVFMIKRPGREKDHGMLWPLLLALEARGIGLYVSPVVSMEAVSRWHQNLLAVATNPYLYPARDFWDNRRMTVLEPNTDESIREIANRLTLELIKGHEKGQVKDFLKVSLLRRSGKGQEVKADLVCLAGHLPVYKGGPYERGKLSPPLDRQQVVERIMVEENLECALSILIDFWKESLGDPSKEATDEATDRLLTYGRIHYQTNLTLDEISQELGYNSIYLGRRFKKSLGISFGRWLDAYRVDQAKSFLEEGYLVKEVCQMVGFKDEEYFSQKFKSNVGVAPSKWKKK